MKHGNSTISTWIVIAFFAAISLPCIGLQAEAGPQPHLKLFGITRDQTARTNVFNRSERVAIMIVVDWFDTEGSPVAESTPIALQPGAMMSFDLNGELPGHSRDSLGRVQLRGVIQTLGGPDTKLFQTLEIIDNATGKTTIFIGDPGL